LPPLGCFPRLSMDERVFRPFGKDLGGQLPAGVAVDAGRIDEEIAGDVFAQSFVRVSHAE